jgi:dethiobiotin synthetase
MIRIVTGAGLGVGKTVACAVLAREDHTRGLSAAYLKPVEIGVRGDTPADAEFVRLAAMINVSEGFRFESKLDPAIAAEQSASTISMDWLVAQARAMAATVDVLYVETTGGMLTPLTGDLTMADLATRVGAEVVIVTRVGLGSLNAAALTLEALRTRALGFTGFVVNRWPTAPGVLERTTLDRIRRLGAVLGLLHEVDGFDTRRDTALPPDLTLHEI